MEKLPEINIIYEDNHLLVVEKPINIPVQEDDSKDLDLITIIKCYLKDKYKKPGNVYLGMVHRLDRPVGGIMVFAKTSKASSRLSEEIRKKEVKKKYYAVLCGCVKDSDVLRDYLVKDNKTNNSYVTTKNKGKEAILEYIRLDYMNNYSLIDVNLITGRSHQIRVQFASRGYPLYGDYRYNKKVDMGSNIALYAYMLEFTHPTLKKKMCFKLDMPNRYPFNLFKEK